MRLFRESLVLNPPTHLSTAFSPIPNNPTAVSISHLQLSLLTLILVSESAEERPRSTESTQLII